MGLVFSQAMHDFQLVGKSPCRGTYPEWRRHSHSLPSHSKSHAIGTEQMHMSPSRFYRYEVSIRNTSDVSITRESCCWVHVFSGLNFLGGLKALGFGFRVMLLLDHNKRACPLWIRFSFCLPVCISFFCGVFHLLLLYFFCMSFCLYLWLCCVLALFFSFCLSLCAALFFSFYISFVCSFAFFFNTVREWQARPLPREAAPCCPKSLCEPIAR